MIELDGRERELLKLLAAGMTDESAAVRLGISARSVRRMMSGVMDRLGARSRFQAGILLRDLLPDRVCGCAGACRGGRREPPAGGGRGAARGGVRR
ncbi:helix-turn-helix domain-containing protein [Actinoplanes auranticolor]|uniref:HTH luxR-type domain-containing protein n=1 Tax=Actinoplanes auranticolor TaxID=47988 RepID=A0A919S663_9ACTN|nr:hypothetical protein Aau02nite_21500 [Actinoplanes auranticolor]